MPRLLELFCGTKSIGRAFEAAGWEVVSLDNVSKFKPTILCDIRSWFVPGHFDMVWASPVCTEYSRALTMRPRRLEEGDALVLRALEIIKHFDPLMWVIENPATGLLKTRPFMERLPWVDSVQEADPTVDHMRWRLEGYAGGRRCDVGQRERVRGQSRELLYSAVQGDCARGHGRACGSAPGLKRGAFLICHFFLGRLGRVVHNCGRACLHAELYAELHAGNLEKKGHACFQFQTLRGQGPKKWNMPVSSSELYAGRARKNGTCLFPVPNSTRARQARGIYYMSFFS